MSRRHLKKNFKSHITMDYNKYRKADRACYDRGGINTDFMTTWKPGARRE
jgi:hypothetical protein